MVGNASNQSKTPAETPRHRGDLEVYPQRRRGNDIWVIKDPISLRYFQFSETEFAVFRWLDGTRALHDVIALHRGQFGPARLTLRQLRGFVARLYQRGLLLPVSSGHSEALWTRRQTARWNRRLQTWSNPLAIRLPGIEPTVFVEKLYSCFAVCFRRSFLFAASVFLISAVAFLIANADRFASGLPTIEAFFTPTNVLLLSAAIACTKFVHELGHALTAHHFGARCSEMGLMLLVFTPCLYCDVSDGWKLPSRFQRIAISAAGIVVEIVLAALCGVLWCLTEPGALHSMLFNIMVVCSVGTVLINANPLLRYDGYYILSDLLDRPNLWQTSRRQMHGMIQRWIGLGREDETSESKVDGFQIVYAAASTVYRVVVLVSVSWLMLRVCSDNGIALVGYLIVGMVAAGVLSTPSYRAAKALRDPVMQKRLRRPRFFMSLGFAAVVAAMVALIPVPSRIAAAARIQPRDARHVYVSVPGTLVKSVSAGVRVKKDQLLAQLESIDVEREILEVESKIAFEEARLSHLRTLRNEHGPLAGQIPAAEQMLKDHKAELVQLKRDREALVLKAPVDGIVLEAPTVESENGEAIELLSWEGSPLDARNQGAYLTRQTLLCLVNPTDQVEAELFVDQFDVGLLREGQSVRLSVESHGSKILTGEVSRISRTLIDVVPRELVAGKRIATEPNQRKPVSPLYRVLVKIDSQDAAMICGATAFAKVSVADQSLAKQLYRVIVRTFTLSSP